MIQIYLTMQEKLIITLWKAQFTQFDRSNSVYCRLTYNNQQRNSKPTTAANNFAWKQTFILPLAHIQIPLKLQFITLNQGQQIHFARDQVAQSLSFAHSTVLIERNNSQTGSLPCKMNIYDRSDQEIGKIFIEYETMKTEVAYTVEKQLDYYYMLKLSNFRVSFVRNLKKTPKFYLKFIVQGKQFKQDTPFQQQSGTFVYNYPVRLYMKKQVQMQIQLFIKDYQDLMISDDYLTETSFRETNSQRKSQPSIGKKEKMMQLGKQKISALIDLNFKRDLKANKKYSLSTLVNGNKRDIGSIEFNVQTKFRTKQQMMALQQQKKGVMLDPQKQSKRKISIVKPSNGIIVINSIMARLQLFNQNVIADRDMSIQVHLGKHIQQSSKLQKPGKELIIIDTFTLRRTWQETVKIVINIHSNHNQKIPYFFTQINLRQLFQVGRYTSKKVKLHDQDKNMVGDLIIDMYYKQQQQKKNGALSVSLSSISESKESQTQSMKAKARKDKIQQRMRKRLQDRQRSRQLASLSTLAVLQQNQIMLPPLRSISKISTLNPKQQKQKNKKNMLLLNKNGNQKFSKAQRFADSYDRYKGFDPYMYTPQSQFDGKKRKRGASIGYGQKQDFVKPLVKNPGVGRYQIPSVWDKYK